MKQTNVKTLVHEYRKAGGDYYFKYLDEAIFGLCTKYPDHADERKVFAKIAMVNNVYRANLQMSGEGAEQRLADNLVQLKFDDALAPLRRMTTFNRATANEIVDVHGYFVETTMKLLGRKTNSFCSKYLNFHFPNIVPIFDRRAYDTIWRYIGAELEHLDYDDKLNADYAYFCAAVQEIIEILEANQIEQPSLKIIDVLLYETLYEE